MRLGIGLIGFGTVGTGFYKRFEEMKVQIQAQTGIEFYLDAIAIKRESHLEQLNQVEALKGVTITTEAEQIIKRPSVKVVVEATCGENPASDYLLESLRAKKYVITANKAAVAKHWTLLHETAKANGVGIYYEGSVAAGIPIIRTLKHLVQVDEVIGIEGILNGTTNYILDRMSRYSENYEEALIKAQSLGYAEAEPSSDIDGVDAANKLAILSNLCFGKVFEPNEIAKVSIRQIKSVSLGTRVIARAEREHNQIQVSLGLEELNSQHEFYGLKGAENAIKIYTKGLGCLTFNGPGAGSEATGTAMLMDLASVAKAFRSI